MLVMVFIALAAAPRSVQTPQLQLTAEDMEFEAKGTSGRGG